MLHLVCDEMKRWCRFSLTTGSMSELIFLRGRVVCSLIPIQKTITIMVNPVTVTIHARCLINKKKKTKNITFCQLRKGVGCTCFKRNNAFKKITPRAFQVIQLNLSTTANSTWGQRKVAVVQKSRVNVWIVRLRQRPNYRGGLCGEVSVSGGSTV